MANCRGEQGKAKARKVRLHEPVNGYFLAAAGDRDRLGVGFSTASLADCAIKPIGDQKWIS